MKRIAVLAGSTALCVSVVGCGGDEAPEAGSIERGLRLIPDEVYDIARGDGVQVLIGDVVAQSEVSRVDDPETGRDVDELTDWFFEISQGVDREESEVTMLLPPNYSRAYVQPDAFADELGFDIGAMTGYVNLTGGGIFDFTVFVGDLEFDVELDVGVGEAATLGDGDEGEIDPELISAINVIGQVLGLAQRDGAVAISRSHEAAEAWVDDDDDDTLADDADYLAVAQALDGAGAVSALIAENDFGELTFASPELVAEMEERARIDEPFDLVGLGMTEVDGDPANVVAYLFDDDDDAASQVDGIEELWTDTELLSRPGERVDDLYDFVSIEQQGPVVVVIVTPGVGQDTSNLTEFLFRLELQFFYV